MLTQLRLDYVVPLPDVKDRLGKWREATVGKSTKAAEQTLLKTFKKRGASVNSPEAMAQLKEVVDAAESSAQEYWDSLNVPLCRLGSSSETSTARGRAMLDALQKAQKSDTAEINTKIGLAAAVAIAERDGLIKAKKSMKPKEKSDKNSSKTCLLTLGRHMLK